MTRSRSAFTLVEMLVSIAVLVLIMTFIGQMMSSISLSTTLSNKHIDTDNQARIVFDRMAMDFAGMPHRQDLQYIFAKEDGTPGGSDDPNDRMFFFSQAPAYFSSSDPDLFPAAGESDPKSDIALIGYCVNTGSNDTGTTPVQPYFLQRLSKGLTWAAHYPTEPGPGGLMFLTFSGSNYNNYVSPVSSSLLQNNTYTSGVVGQYPAYSGTAAASTDSDFATLATQVFRLEFCFEVKDLTPGGPGGTVFSNYPVAEFTDTAVSTNLTNTTFKPDTNGDPFTDPPTGSNAQGVGAPNSKIHVGDRWYSNQDSIAYECTAFSTAAGPTWTPIGLSDVKAIVVAIAVMDTNSRKTLSRTEIADAASYLPDFPQRKTPTSDTPLMQSLWQSALDAQPTTFASTVDIPQSAASQIRVYQRFFYLNNN